MTRFRHAASIMALVLGCHGAAAAEPVEGLWVAYNARSAFSIVTPGEEGWASVTHGDGADQFFSLRLQNAGERVTRAEFVTSAGFDSYLMRARKEPDSAASDPYSRANRDFVRTLIALGHHRPAVSFAVDERGAVDVTYSEALRAHQDCARRRLRAAQEALVETAENTIQRQSQLERLHGDYVDRVVEIPVGMPAVLARLVRLDLPVAEESAASPLAPTSVTTRGGEPTQPSWRSEQIRLHGRRVGLTLDLTRDRSSHAAGICRALQPRPVGSVRSDRCSIHAFIDSRDGWPIILTFSRVVEGEAGALASESRHFYRVSPLEGYVAPANPCA